MSTELVSKFYYHGITRKLVVAFGDLFSHIEVVRFNADGTENNRQVVPIYYGPKEKWAVRNEQDPNFERSRAILLPRMSFEIVKYQKAAQRQQPHLTYLKHKIANDPLVPGNLPNKMHHVFQPVPYDIIVELNIISKSADEASQIVEQILPMFPSDYAISINLVDEIKSKLNVPISLSDVDCQDSWDGEFTQRRQIEWKLTFTMSAAFYGPVRDKPVVQASTVVYNTDDAATIVQAAGTDPTSTEPIEAVKLDLVRLYRKGAFGFDL